MADERVRHLEREAAGGDLEATARLLRERVRTGDLPLHRLELAAKLLDPAARLALGEPPPKSTMEWAAGLERFGHHLGLRVVVEMASCGVALLDPATRDASVLRMLVQRARALTAHPERLGAPLAVREFPDERGPLWQAILAALRTANARPCYLDDDDPELLRSYTEHVPRRHPHPKTGGRWRYTHTALDHLRRWTHHFEHPKHPVSGFPARNTFPAAPGWRPDAETPEYPPARLGALGECLVELAAEVVAIGGDVESAVESALVPWALR